MTQKISLFPSSNRGQIPIIPLVVFSPDRVPGGGPRRPGDPWHRLAGFFAGSYFFRISKTSDAWGKNVLLPKNALIVVEGT